MRTYIDGVDIEHGLARLGAFLAILLALLADRGYASNVTLSNRTSGFLARRAIDSIAVVGWLADHLPQRTTGTRGHDEQTTHHRWARGV